MDKKLLNFIHRGEVMALIPARGGSKTVPQKNIRLFRGHPLIAYSIAAAKLSKKVNRIMVSTDSEEIGGIAVEYGAEVPFLRPKELAQDDSPDIEFVEHAIEWLFEHEGTIPEYLVHLRPTTPIRSWRTLNTGIFTILENEAATSLRSVHLCEHSPFKWFLKRESGYLKALLPYMTCDDANKPRQCFPTVYVPNGYIDILKSDYVIKNDLLHGERSVAFETEEVPDIDTMTDLKKLEAYPDTKAALQELAAYLDEYKR